MFLVPTESETLRPSLTPSSAGPPGGEPARQDPASSWLQRLRPAYLGASLTMVWHLSRWIMPDNYPTVAMTDGRVVTAQSYEVAASLIALLLVILRDRRRDFSPSRLAIVVTTAAAVVTTITTPLLCGAAVPIVAPIVSGVVLGVTTTILWMSWGVVYFRRRVRFSLDKVDPWVGPVVAIVLAVIWLTPGWTSLIVIALLPAASGVLIIRSLGAPADTRPPAPLPSRVIQLGRRSILLVVVTSAFVVFACSFAAQVSVGVDTLLGNHTLGVGAILGCLSTILIGPLSRLVPHGKAATATVAPWLMMIMIVACVLSLWPLSPGWHLVAVLLAFSALMITLIRTGSFLGVAMNTGYLTPAVAFAAPCCIFRVGWSVSHAVMQLWTNHAVFTTPIGIVIVIVLTCGLILFVRKEDALLELDGWSMPKEEQPDLTPLTQLAQDFGLSEREKEVVALIGRGYSAKAIGEKLFITTSTVNSHIMHIYDKIGIHKRTELIVYLESYAHAPGPSAGTTPARWPDPMTNRGGTGGLPA